MNDNYYRHINGVPYKMHCFIEMQFAAHFYTVVPYQALFNLPIYKNSAISKSGAIFLSFCKIRDFGSPTNTDLSVSICPNTSRKNARVMYTSLYPTFMSKNWGMQGHT